MEAEVLKTHNFEMGNPTVKMNVDRFIIAQEDSDVRVYAMKGLLTLPCSRTISIHLLDLWNCKLVFAKVASVPLSVPVGLVIIVFVRVQHSANTPCANNTHEPPIKNSVSVAEGSTSVSNKQRHSLTEGASTKRLDTGGASQGNNIDTHHRMQGNNVEVNGRQKNDVCATVTIPHTTYGGFYEGYRSSKNSLDQLSPDTLFYLEC
uniref:Uncharacterized protein n=1 Tax=Tanacetum cinerariifolium TaxID=118510 RepID=A0A699HAD6_TANCI|nr:hypothetical protein [Tanacetum cinerariifolium]